MQNYEIETHTYAIYSLDQSLGFLGGYSSLLWAGLGLLIGVYQDFSYMGELKEHLYQEEKRQRDNADIESDDEKEVQAVILN